MTFLGFDVRDARMLNNLLQMSVRDKFLGSSLGRIWAIANPLLLMGIFTFMFTVVFPQRLPGASSSATYIIWLLSGYGPWLSISEGISTATGSVVANGSLIKNLVFKSELLPVVGSLIGFIPLFVSVVVLIAIMAITGHAPHWTWIAIPFIAFLQLLLIAGCGFFLASINVFVRDTVLVLPSVLTLALFASPIFYQVSAYPEILQPIVAISPIYLIAEGYRQPIINGSLPPFGGTLLLACISVAVFVLGLAFFRRLKPYFDARL
jgi:lipopolysaccharide transport system permease protein